MVKLLQAQQELQTQNVRMLEGQREAGAVSVFDVTQAGIAADGARLVLRDAERQQAEALVQLAAAIGVPVKALEGVRFAFAALSQIQPVASVAEARRQALLNRSDILGALAEYDASESALQLEITRQYPDVHLSPGYQYDQGDNKWTLGITVELPLLNQNKGRIAEAQAKRAEIAARFNALQAGVISDIDRALAGYDAALRNQADADEMVSRLQKQEERARGRFEVGDISKSDLVLQQLQLSTSAQARLEAIIKSQQALVQLEETLQGPLGLPDSVWQVSPRVVESQQAKTH
jgi:outer membrane protein TolC